MKWIYFVGHVAFAGYQLLTPNLRNIDFYLCTNIAKTDSKQQLRLLAKFNFSMLNIKRSGPQADKLAKQAPASSMQTQAIASVLKGNFYQMQSLISSETSTVCIRKIFLCCTKLNHLKVSKL